MTKDRAQYIVDQLASFAKLARKSTDEAGWIALKFGVEHERAAKMIDEARAELGGEGRAVADKEER